MCMNILFLRFSVIFLFSVVGASQFWSCCEGSVDSEGCQVSTCHVTETQDYSNMTGFMTSLDKVQEEEYTGKVYAMDCEMVNTTLGSELVRVTMIDYTGESCYESLVKPDNKIVDYNTRYFDTLRLLTDVIQRILVSSKESSLSL